MAAKWSQVSASPGYQSLSEPDKYQAQDQYFEQVIAPQLVNPQDKETARQQFYQQNGRTVGPAPMNEADIPSKSLRMISAGFHTALPISAVQDLAKTSMGQQPAGLGTVGDAASLGLFGAQFIGGPVGPALRTTALMGAGSAAAEGLGVKNPVLKFTIPAALGLIGGHIFNPQTSLQAVPKGDEANAVARLAQKMGVNVAEAPREAQLGGLIKGGTYPRDVAQNWKEAINELGQRVKATKDIALETAASVPEIVKTMEAVPRGMQAPGVLNTGSGPLAALSNNPKALDLVQSRLNDAIEAVRQNKISPQDAMEGLNNALEGLKSSIAQSANYGENMAGAAAGAGTSGWQNALNALAKDPEALAAHNAANLQYRKGLALQDLVKRSVSGKAGETAGFNPRTFSFDVATAGIKPNSVDLSMFDPKEQAAIRQLAENNPGLVKALMQKLSDFKKGIYQEPLRFHPGTNLYEQRPNYLPAGNLPAPIGAGARGASYDASEDPRLKAMQNALRLSKVK